MILLRLLLRMLLGGFLVWCDDYIKGKVVIKKRLAEDNIQVRAHYV